MNAVTEAIPTPEQLRNSARFGTPLRAETITALADHLDAQKELLRECLEYVAAEEFDSSAADSLHSRITAHLARQQCR